ncbi:MAG: DinB family protein [Cyclobacteriaceae bacterium]
MENTCTRLIRDILDSTGQMEANLKAEYLHRAEDILKQRPAPGQWSIGETAVHTSIVMEIYLAHIKDSLRHASPTVQSKTCKSGFNGRLMIKLLAPKDGRIRWKIPTLAHMEPQQDDNESALEHVQDLITTLGNFRSLTRECESYDLNKVKVSSALGKLIRFRLGDALRIVATHNERHLVQMSETLKKVASELPAYSSGS